MNNNKILHALLITQVNAVFSIIGFAILALSPASYAEVGVDPGVSTQPVVPPYRGSYWSITPGVGVRVVSLDVTRKSDGYSGTLTNDGSFSDPIYFSLDIETPTYMLDDKVGVSMLSSSQTFKITRQEVKSSTTTTGTDYADLGTSAEGFYSYLGPTIFYNVDEVGGDARFGFGFGYWKAWFDGDIILGPDGNVSSGMPHTKINGKVDGSTGPMFFFQARNNQFAFEIRLSQVDFKSSEYKTTLSELGMSIGFHIFL